MPRRCAPTTPTKRRAARARHARPRSRRHLLRGPAMPVQSISFSGTRYPHIKRHTERAIRRGWPTVLVVNRPGEDARRDRLLAGWPTRVGYDRDEYPPAVGRGRGKGLTRGSHPRGWKADVAYVPSSENRSHGSVLGIKLRRLCNGTRFRYVFYQAKPPGAMLTTDQSHPAPGRPGGRSARRYAGRDDRQRTQPTGASGLGGLTVGSC